jgi:protein TonB
MAFDSAELEGFPGRRMRFALGASFVLHAVVLWSSAAPLLTHDTAPALTASLRPSALPVATPAPSIPPVAVASPPIKPQPRVIATNEPAPAVSPAPTFVPAVPAPVTVAPTSVTPVAATATALPAATESPPAADTADGLRGYRLALATQARRFKRYPPQAMASGWKGTAEIRLELGADGRPLPALVTRSSGHESLDRAAQAMIDAGALRASVPESLKGRAFAVVLPVVFNLDE